MAGQRQGFAEQGIIISISIIIILFQPGAFSGFRGLAKCEPRGMEGTDVIRRTSSTFSLQEVGSESAILKVKLVLGERRRETL